MTSPPAATSRQPPLAARALRKSYGGHEVLHGVDLDLAGGTATVLLGANGAGKTTLVRILAGELLADQGAVKVAGHDLGTDAAIAGLVHVAQDPPLADFLTTREHATAMAELRGRPIDAVTADLEAAADKLALKPHLDRPVFALSGGMRQKAALSLAFASGAGAILLDEPYAGLDIRAAHALRELINLRRDAGAALLIASHLAEAALAVADRAIVLGDGRIALDLDKAALDAFGADPRAFEQAVLQAM